MPKARLHLIVCSGDIGTEARDRQRERSFQLSVIDGGRRAIVAQRGNPGENPWGGLLDLFDLAVVVSQANYQAFVAASLTALELHGWTDLKQAK